MSVLDYNDDISKANVVYNAVEGAKIHFFPIGLQCQGILTNHVLLVLLIAECTTN